jgi:MFS family permease
MEKLPNEVTQAIFAGCVVAFIGFGFAASFGLFLSPISDELGWGREVFSLSVAIQMLCWGIAQPFAGAIADRYGTARVLFAGCILSAFGFLIRGLTSDPTIFVVSGFFAGAGTGAISLPIVIVALGKVVPEERRSFVMGLGTAVASLGMFASAPASAFLIETLDWRNAILVISASYLAILPFLGAIARVSKPTAGGGGLVHFKVALRDAFSDRSYLCLFFGFFVCGFHVAFIQTHLPAYITDLGVAAKTGAWALALIGLFNIAGSFMSGWIGQNHSKKISLSSIYLLRSIVISIFVLAPLSEFGVYVFAAAMGILWLSTVPLTTGLIAHTQGLRFLSTLAGLVFFSHQVGSFIGVWLGGWIFDTSQSYALVWWIAVALGLFAALIHLPIREYRPAVA